MTTRQKNKKNVDKKIAKFTHTHTRPRVFTRDKCDVRTYLLRRGQTGVTIMFTRRVFLYSSARDDVVMGPHAILHTSRGYFRRNSVSRDCATSGGTSEIIDRAGQ